MPWIKCSPFALYGQLEVTSSLQRAPFPLEAVIDRKSWDPVAIWRLIAKFLLSGQPRIVDVISDELQSSVDNQGTRPFTSLFVT